jgi:hypothetical protein
MRFRQPHRNRWRVGHRGQATMVLLVATTVSLSAGLSTADAHKLPITRAHQVAVKKVKQWAKQRATAEQPVTATHAGHCRRMSAHRVSCPVSLETVHHPVDPETNQPSATPEPLTCRRKLSIRFRSATSHKLRVAWVGGSLNCTPGETEPFDQPDEPPPTEPAIPPDQPIDWPDITPG